MEYNFNLNYEFNDDDHVCASVRDVLDAGRAYPDQDIIEPHGVHAHGDVQGSSTIMSSIFSLLTEWILIFLIHAGYQRSRS